VTTIGRDDAICQAYLLWQRDNDGRRPNPEEFLTLGVEMPDGVSITPEELETNTAYLQAAGLIKGHSVWNRPMLQKVKLTGDGIRCVREFGGDVQFWNRRNNTSVDQSVRVHADGDAQVVAHSRDVTQVQAAGDVNVDRLADAARRAKEYLPALSLSEMEKKDVEEAAGEILDEAAKAEPDQGRLRALGARLKTGITVAASTGTLGKLIIEALVGAGVQ